MGPSSSSNAVRPRLFAVTDALVIAQEALAWSRGLQRIVLTVQTANPEALKFYQRHGKTAPPLQPGRCCILYHPLPYSVGAACFTCRSQCAGRWVRGVIGYHADSTSPELCPDECSPQKLPDGLPAAPRAWLCICLWISQGDWGRYKGLPMHDPE